MRYVVEVVFLWYEGTAQTWSTGTVEVEAEDARFAGQRGLMAIEVPAGDLAGMYVFNVRGMDDGDR